MKFAHMADCHIGGWREPRLKEASSMAFEKAVNTCIEKGVDFVLISGDLFNTALPSIDALKSTVVKIKELKDKDIQVYVIAGSHDFSSSGKTILDVLEHAGLITNVARGSVEGEKLKLKFTVDKKTGAKITGLLGKKGSLERSYYESLDSSSLEKEEGYKIFMFHSAISELKPKEMEKMESMALSFLPRNFDYYAGGHVHFVKSANIEGYRNVVFPGPLFPNNFRELEELKTGGFYIVDGGNPVFQPIQVYNVHSINIDCKHKLPAEILSEIEEMIKNREFINTIVTIRLSGKLKSGKPSDVDLRDIYSRLYAKSAVFVMKNTYSLFSEEFEEIKIEPKSTEEIEEGLIKEHINQIKMDNVDAEKEMQWTRELMHALNIEKEDGEKSIDFEKRLKSEAAKIIDTDLS